jgi:hypothetical protein
VSPRSRRTKSTSRALETEEKRLLTAVLAVMRTSSGCRTTNDRPSAISVRSGRRDSRPGGVSACRIRSVYTMDARKLPASSRIVSGAPSARTRKPPIAGPATCATEWLACSLALPSPIRSEGTRAGRWDG